MGIYFDYHKHSDYSLLDSCTNFKDYIDYEVSLGHKATAFTEHGKPMGWIAKKMYCDEKGIKYVHGVECYLTASHDEKVRDNYHTVLLAKNFEGVKEINELISRSTDEYHTYYNNRISFEEFLSISDNVIKTSACLASPLWQLEATNPIYEKLVQHYDYLEIQAHDCADQKTFNLMLYELAKKYSKKLIAATDTHNLNQYKAECRQMLLLYKDRSYGNEDSFDLCYKTYDELVAAFERQNALPREVFLEAIENTNRLADIIEPFELDKSLKYPILYGTREKDKEVFYKTIDSNFSDKVAKGIITPEQVQPFKEAIEEEKRVFGKIEMDGFMLSMSELITWCKENNIPVGPGRGSCCGSRIAYVTNIIDVNPETWHTVFSRFCNEDRKEVGDIDIDVIASDRPKIFKYIVGRFGVPKTARVPSFGTMADKAVIDGVCNALDKIWHKEHGEKGESPYSLKAAKVIKSQFEADPEKAKKDYPKVFYYFDGLAKTKISQSVHPAGMVISPITLADNYGVFLKDGDYCMMIDMEEIHEIGLVKYDFLILKTVGVINDTYKLLNKPYPRSDEIDWNDEKVWKDMSDNSATIFQFEENYAGELLKRFQPRSIFDMSLVTASLRPSGASYRNALMAKTLHKNPSELIDNLLERNYGYLVYQEDIIAFLQQVCGLTGSEADNVRRAISRKQNDRLQRALPQILEGYCSKSEKPREEAEAEAREFLQIIEDASSYMFGYNHSVAYCLIGYMCAYLRYYHPLEYITAYLNNAANETDIVSGTDLAKNYDITITPPLFGESSAMYRPHKENNTISKGIATVKYLNETVGDELYTASTKELNSFVEVLEKCKEIGVTARQLDILIKVGYFRKYGNINELMRITAFYSDMKFGAIHSVSKDKLHGRWYENIIEKYSTDIGVKGNILKNYTIRDMNSILLEGESFIKSRALKDLDMKL